MAKIVLNDLTNTYSPVAINENFDRIVAEFQDKVLYRDNPVGEANTLQTDVDVNSKRLYNLAAPQSPNDALRLTDLPTSTGTTTAVLTTFSPTGGVAAATVQAAIEELDLEKVRLDSLASTTDATKGSGLSGHGGNLNYAAGTLGAGLNDAGKSVKMFPWLAVGDGVADDAVAINASPNRSIFPPGSYKTNTALPVNRNHIAYSAAFSGTARVDSWTPGFGVCLQLGMTTDGSNALVGAANNNLSAATSAFPTGATGYGRTNNAGNQVFGLFGRADLYNTGVATNEVNSFNFFGAPSATLPPDRAIGTTQTLPVALTVAAGGNFNSAIGIHVVQEGGAPRQFLAGFYSNYDSCLNYGIYVAAHATLGGPTTSAAFENSGSGTNLLLQTKGTAAANNAMLQCLDQSGVLQMAIKQDGHLAFKSAISQTTVGPAGAAAVLPSNPTGYIKFEVGGLVKVIPYYEAS